MFTGSNPGLWAALHTLVIIFVGWSKPKFGVGKQTLRLFLDSIRPHGCYSWWVAGSFRSAVHQARFLFGLCNALGPCWYEHDLVEGKETAGCPLSLLKVLSGIDPSPVSKGWNTRTTWSSLCSKGGSTLVSSHTQCNADLPQGMTTGTRTGMVPLGAESNVVATQLVTTKIIIQDNWMLCGHAILSLNVE